MLDIRLLRDRPEEVKAGLARRGAAHLLEDVLAADERLRALVARVEALRAEQNTLSRRVGRAEAAEREALLARARELKADLEVLEPQLRELEEARDHLLAQLPNLPHESVPDGETDEDNAELWRWGEPRELPGARDHLDLGRLWGVIDTERAARASGSRFGYLMGEVVFLEFALVRFALDRLAAEGFVAVVPPVLVRREVMFGAGALPGDEAQYYVVQDGLYLTGTSEQALAALHMDEELAEDSLPRRYSGFSTCFRREAGTWGRDTRGIFRVHQFDKVEMFSFAHPERSWEEHDYLIARQEELLQALGLAYRAVNVCAGELGAPAAKKVDLEAWFPGQRRYREVTSCSNCTDYQARRLRIRLKGQRRPVHTLNGTAYAIGRTVAAILETYQEPSGEVALPEVLHPYLPDGMTRIPAPPRRA